MSKTAWPTVTDITSLCSAMNVTLSASTAVQSNVIDAVVQHVHTRTRRIFVPVTETRYYNGNDTGEIEVDEYCTISTINVVGWFGVTPGLSLENFSEVKRVGFPKTKIQIFKGSLPAFYRVWIDRFPQGRSNIAITADWGYDTTIPDDLWLAVANQAAYTLINWKQFDGSGFLIKWEEADVAEVRNLMNPFNVFKGNTGTDFKAVLNRYKKPAGYFMRNQNRDLM